ncbi:MAG: helicase SNF2, partial [Lachnospiraceae bacterium]|nr:helicase SNF2 [Lachnospiraceae bacterium]
MKKYEIISALSDTVSKKVIRNEESWRQYLNTASRLYKYPFRDQLLIYGQRPDATACASLETWNEKMNCWVNRGAKGIALIDTDSEHPRLKYVFDVSDVHKAKRIGRDPYLWELREEHKTPVLAQLEKTYGATDPQMPFEQRMIEIADRIAQDYYEELLPEVTYAKEGSSLDDLDEWNLGIRLRETLASSISFTLLSRCGADMDLWKDEMDFGYIHEFNNTKVLAVMGNAITEICKPMLIEIGRTIRAYERQLLRNKTREKAAVEPMKRADNHTEMEGIANETDIREEWGLSDSEPHTEPGTGSGTDKVWANEEKLPEGTKERDLSGNDTDRRAERALSDDTGAGRAENGVSDRADEDKRGSDRTAQSGKSDALASEDEQYQAFSGGDRTDGTDLQLNKEEKKPDSGTLSGFSLSSEEQEGTYQQLSLFPSFEEQVGTVAAAEANVKYTMPAAFSLPQEQIDSILRSGGGRNNSRTRIYAKYQQGKTPEEMAEFLKNEYKTTGKGFEFDGNPVSLWFDEMGMSIGYGTSAKENPLAVMSWSEVESHIRVMVENGTYMSANEVFLLDAAERERIATDINNFFRDGISEMPESLELKFSNYPASMERLCGLLSTTEGRELIKDELEKAKAQLDSGEKQIKWRYVKRPDYLLEQLADLGVEKKEFPVPDTVEVRNEDFITQDEIDYRLTGGSGFEHGKFRIYEYFMEGHDKKDNIAFLKNEYGTGGSSHALPGSDRAHEDHDAKGIRLEKGNYGSPYAKVLLNWNV